MKKIIVPFLLGVIVSFYFFPIGFTFTPPAFNTKIGLAVIGALVFLYDSIRSRSVVFSKEVFFAAIIAAIFSLSCYFSAYVNNTGDMSYATYFVSFFVWLGGAYGTIFFLRMKYDKVDIYLLSKYLLWVAFAQCVSAVLIDEVPAFSAFVDSFMEIGQQSLREINRKYGLGSALDAGGVRFAIILVVSAYGLCQEVFAKETFWKSAMFILAYFFVILEGNIISRTTTVGAALGLGYIFLYLFKLNRGILSMDRVRSFTAFIIVLTIAIPIVTFLYNTDADMHSNLRFAFEGFFNWAETGKWSTSSTDKLNSVMWIWPQDMKTWIIGSGLFGGWVFSTDIGYCRFILYCGLIGFSIFSFFFIYNAYLVSLKFKNSWLLALLLLALTFIIWIKVATDIFMIYALLFCVEANSSMLENQEDEQELPPADDLDARLARWANRPVSSSNR